VKQLVEKQDLFKVVSHYKAIVVQSVNPDSIWLQIPVILLQQRYVTAFLIGLQPTVSLKLQQTISKMYTVSSVMLDITQYH